MSKRRQTLSDFRNPIIVSISSRGIMDGSLDSLESDSVARKRHTVLPSCCSRARASATSG